MNRISTVGYKDEFERIPTSESAVIGFGLKSKLHRAMV